VAEWPLASYLIGRKCWRPQGSVWHHRRVIGLSHGPPASRSHAKSYVVRQNARQLDEGAKSRRPSGFLWPTDPHRTARCWRRHQGELSLNAFSITRNWFVLHLLVVAAKLLPGVGWVWRGITLANKMAAGRANIYSLFDTSQSRTSSIAIELRKWVGRLQFQNATYWNDQE
jgi:hypothetical protein